MNEETFENTLRKFLRNKPFHPFQVELLDGKVIVIERPGVAFGGGAATMITEDEFIEFECENVREMRYVPIPSIS